MLASHFGTTRAPKEVAHHTAVGVLTKAILADCWLLRSMDLPQRANADQNYFDSDRKIVTDPA